MKKSITTFALALFTLFGFKSFGTIYTVNVEDFEFSPADLTINLGDQIMWMWDNSGGQHTTTSTTIPVGAASWDQVISQSSQMFTYTPTVPGSYDYICVYHQSMGMIGHFHVSGVGIESVIPAAVLSIKGAYSTGESITIKYGLPQTQNVSMRIADMLGKTVNVFFSENKSAGTYDDTYSIAGLRNGIYFLELKSDNATVTKKIIVE